MMYHQHCLLLQLSSNDVPLDLDSTDYWTRCPNLAPMMNHWHCLRLGSIDVPSTLSPDPTIYHQQRLRLQLGSNDVPSDYWTQWTVWLSSILAWTIYYQHHLWLQLGCNDEPLASSLARLQQCTINIVYGSSSAPMRYHWTIGLNCTRLQLGLNNLPSASSTASTQLQQWTIDILSDQLQQCTIDIVYGSNDVPSTSYMAPTWLQWCTFGLLDSAPTQLKQFTNGILYGFNSAPAMSHWHCVRP